MHPGKRIVLGLERDGDRLRLPLTIGSAVEKDRFGNESRVGRLGVWSSPIRYQTVGPVAAVRLAVEECVDLVRMMVTGIAQIFTGDRSVKELGGPIKIAKFSGEQLSLGWTAFVGFAALISLNLAFINLLPIPALDGGHLAFYAAEAVRRKPIGARGQEMAFRAGVAVILALMLFVTVNDLLSLPIFG
jgi:regulator of sigma E protease